MVETARRKGPDVVGFEEPLGFVAKKGCIGLLGRAAGTVTLTGDDSMRIGWSGVLPSPFAVDRDDERRIADGKEGGSSTRTIEGLRSRATSIFSGTVSVQGVFLLIGAETALV